MAARLQRGLDLVAERRAEDDDIDDPALAFDAGELPGDVDVHLPLRDDPAEQPAGPPVQGPDLQAGALDVVEVAGALQDEAGDLPVDLALDDLADLGGVEACVAR